MGIHPRFFGGSRTLKVSAGAHAQNGVAGAWDLAINGPEGAINATATLKQDGDNVIGQIETPQGVAEVKGTYEGTTLNMSFTFQSPQGPLEIKVNVTTKSTSLVAGTAAALNSSLRLSTGFKAEHAAPEGGGGVFGMVSEHPAPGPNETVSA